MSAVVELSGTAADVVTGVDVGNYRDAWCAAVVRTVTEAVAAGKTDLAGWAQAWRQGELEPPDPDLDQSYLDRLTDLVAIADRRYDEMTLARLDDELRSVGAVWLAGAWDQVTARAAEWRWQRCLAELSATPWDGAAESWPDFHEAVAEAAQRWRVSAELSEVLDGGYEALHRHALVLPVDEHEGV